MSKPNPLGFKDHSPFSGFSDELIYGVGPDGHASKRGAPAGSWLEQMLTRKPRMLVTVALANKTARIIWTVLMKNEDYKAPDEAAA